MVMQAMRVGASNRILRVFIFGILMLATAGLMLSGGMDFSGTVGRNDVAKVAGETITLPVFDRTLRQTLSRIGMQPAEAYKFGYINQLLGGEVNSRLVAKGAEDNGIAIDQARVAERIRAMIRPIMREGQTEEEVLKNVLMAQGMNEGELIESIRREMAGGLMIGSIKSGFSVISDPVLKDLYASQNEKRDVSFVTFLEKDSPEPAAPSDEDLMKLYEAGKEEFAIPETRKLQLIRLRDENLRKMIEITDEELKNNYESYKDAYTTTAKHTLEQALTSDEAQAKKIFDAVKAGKSIEKSVKDVTKTVIAYLGVQEFDDAQMVPELKDAVLKAKEGDLIGPVKTGLGWHVVRIQERTPEGTRPFEAVRDEIKKDLTENRLADAKYDAAGAIEDMLASGTPLVEIKKQSDIEVTDLPVINAFGQGTDGKDALKDYPKNAASILENGFKIAEGETSTMAEMPDGAFVAVRAEKITPKTYKPFEDVRGDLKSRWMSDQRRVENRLRALGVLESMKKDNKSIADIAGAQKSNVRVLKDVLGTAKPPAPIVASSMPDIFEAALSSPVLIDVEGGNAIAVVTDVRWPEKIDEKSEGFQEFKKRLQEDIQNEALSTYATKLAAKYKPSVNDRLIEQVYGKVKTGEETP
jgi:peptidyl-prolyl cis-trans isomerase D